MHDAPFYDKIKPSRAFPKLTGFRNWYCTSDESELVSKLRIYIDDLGHPATLHTMYGIPPLPHTMYDNPPPSHTMYDSLPHTMYEPPHPLHTMYEALPHTMYDKLRTLTSWRLDQENQISTPHQKQPQNCYFWLWFCRFLARGDPWLFWSVSR